MPSSFALKLISKDSIPDSLKKAERYRLLGEPDEAESVCLDILQVDPGNQEALVDLVLAISDQFRRERRPRVELALRYVSELTDEYQCKYYKAVVLEREAMIHLDRGTPPALILIRFAEAMDRYEEAAAIRPPGDDSPILRWNACVRAIRRQQLKPDMGKEDYTSE
jgi:tetratricopeptide (TPR) repeat protein